MKSKNIQLLVTSLLAFSTLSMSSFGKDRAETATVFNSFGKSFEALYIYNGAQCKEVDLAPSVGGYIKIDIEPGTSNETVDRVVLRIADTLN